MVTDFDGLLQCTVGLDNLLALVFLLILREPECCSSFLTRGLVTRTKYAV